MVQRERNIKNNPTSQSSALVLIEFQNAWLAEGAKLATFMQDTAQFETAKQQAKKALAFARKVGMHVVHVPFIVSGDYKELGGDKAHFGLRAAIQKAGTWQDGAKAFHEDFMPLPHELVVSGRVGASGFAGSNLDALLRNNTISTLYLAGFATNVCVESTLREAHDRGYETFVLADASSTFTHEQKVFFEQHIVHHFGAMLLTKTWMAQQ